MDHIFLLVSHYGYLIIFPLMIIEGPIVTIIASFLASLGAFNILIIYILGVAGNIIGDAIYYSIGKFGREKFLHKYGKYISVDEKKVEYIENHYKKHMLKTILIAKITEAPIIPALISAGIAKTNFKKFITICALAEIPKVAIIVSIGYFFGKFYTIIDSYFKNFVSIMFAALGLVITFFILKFIFKKIRNKNKIKI